MENGISEIPKLRDHLFEYQADCVRFGLRRGSWGLFLDTGLGKTACELEWCKVAAEQSNGMALILTPLAVARQIEREAIRWGYGARVVREQSDCRPGINICNYDRLDKLDPDAFGAVALDESSILKAQSGKTSASLIASFSGHRWKMCATATPAPNDHMELGQHSAFLSIMPSNEMLMRWFINDSSDASKSWRLKGHARTDFWDWMSSWSRMGERPSDLGDESTAYALPRLEVVRHRCESTAATSVGELFGTQAVSATDMFDLKRRTASERAGLVASLIESEPDEPWVVWCDTNGESDALMALLGPDAVEVRGSQSIEEKESALESFSSMSKRVIVTKPSIAGHGLNWQHSARMAFIGRTFSYEDWYQAVRRCWRYGQTRDVVVHIAVADGEDSIGRVLDRKADDHARMKAEMIDAMRRNAGRQDAKRVTYDPKHEGRMPSWFVA